mmetsp:Transcript_12995/g.38815  ORF Transcript_12995/g.38815 Transcript_12995/m.38815 type:complete len:290 (-) Transcript_12995:60-929(-)
MAGKALLLALCAAALVAPLAAFTSGAERAANAAMTAAQAQVSALEKAIEGGDAVENLGAQIDGLVEAVERSFTAGIEKAGVSEADAAQQRELMMKQLEGPLSGLFLQQLRRLREQALEKFRTDSGNGGSEAAEFDAMLIADKTFAAKAEESQPTKCISLFQASFDYGIERSELQELLREVASRTKSVTDARLEAARQQAEALKYLGKQQQELAECQRQQYSAGPPFSFGCAYKVPLTNINLSGTYQNGKTKLVCSVVDEPVLNNITPDQGFVTGLDDGAMGLSFNMNLF